MIFNLVKGDVTRRGYHFSPEMERTVRQLISDGIDRITDLDDDNQRRTAEANARKGINELLRLAAKTSSNEIGIDLYYRTRSSVCPIWPYCD